MIEHMDSAGAGFTTSPWSAEGVATLEAMGSDMRSALEAGLRATLALTSGLDPARTEAGRSAPVRGEGADLAGLFANMLEDLLAQIEFFGAGLDDVVVDGVLRRDDGGYVAWGYATGLLDPASAAAPPHLHGVPTAVEGNNRFTIRAELRRL